MMSTATIVATGTGQVNARPGSAGLSVDNSGPEGASFAKSFNERVVGPAQLEEKSSADKVTTTLQNSKTGVVAKKVIEIAEMPIRVEGNAVAARQTSEHTELKGRVSPKIVQPQATATAGSKEKTTEGCSTTDEVKSPALVEEESDDTSIASRFPYASSVVRLTNEGLNPSVRREEDRPSASSARDPLVQKETEIGGKTKDVTSEKKTAKQQDSTATIKAAQNSVEAAVKTSAIETPAATSSVEDAILAVGPASATGLVPRSEISNTKGGFSESISRAVEPSAEIGPATVEGLAHKDVVPGAKNSAIDPQTPVTTADDQVGLPKPVAGMEKMPAIAPPRGEDENKTQGTPMSAAVAAHSMAGVSWVSGGAPTAVMSGSTPGELAAAKFPVGESSPHSAGLPNGSNEQDGVSVAAASMDGAPRMLLATPTALEVGIQDGTHGWLKVRAEMVEGGGVVNASVTATSSAGQEMLHRELPALTAYLLEEKVSVNAVVVHASSTVAAESRRSAGMDGAGGQTPQRNNEGEEQQQNIRKPHQSDTDEAMTFRSLHGVDQDGSIPLAAYARGGGWLSVRA